MAARMGLVPYVHVDQHTLRKNKNYLFYGLKMILLYFTAYIVLFRLKL
jgi:hypothetical protein